MQVKENLPDSIKQVEIMKQILKDAIELNPSRKLLYKGEEVEIEEKLFDTKGKEMTFTTGDGTLCFVNQEGKLYVIPWTDERYDTLKKSGYKLGAFTYPHAPEYSFDDPELNEKWNQIMKNSTPPKNFPNLKELLGK